MACERVEQNIEICEGADIALSFTWPSETTPTNLTGYTARMQVRRKRDSADVIFDLTTANGGIVLDADQVENTGKFQVVIAAEDNQELCEGQSINGFYDLFFTVPGAGPEEGGTKQAAMYGTFKINAAVTRPWEDSE